MKASPIRVLCVDDNHHIAEAVRRKLELEGGFEWLGHLSTADTLTDELRRRDVDVVLLDIDMPGKDPFEVLAEATRLWPTLRVVILSGHIRRELVDLAFSSGAWGYLSKSEGTSEIPRGLRRAVAGEVVMSRDVELACGA